MSVCAARAGGDPHAALTAVVAVPIADENATLSHGLNERNAKFAETREYEIRPARPVGHFLLQQKTF